ncbi:MAG: hypothetical protein QM742_15550 [Aquabacterium sp.]
MFGVAPCLGACEPEAGADEFALQGIELEREFRARKDVAGAFDAHMAHGLGGVVGTGVREFVGLYRESTLAQPHVAGGAGALVGLALQCVGFEEQGQFAVVGIAGGHRHGGQGKAQTAGGRWGFSLPGRIGRGQGRLIG